MTEQDHADLRALAEKWRHFGSLVIADLDHWLAAHPASEGWQPIATAPKDGTYFLAWAKQYLQPSIARWLYGEYRWLAQEVRLACTGACGGYAPTHWRPLPAPPAAEESKP